MTSITYHCVDSSTIAITTVVRSGIWIGIGSRTWIRRWRWRRRFDFESSLDGLDLVFGCEALASHEDVAVLREVTGVRCVIAQRIVWVSF